MSTPSGTTRASLRTARAVLLILGLFGCSRTAEGEREAIRVVDDDGACPSEDHVAAEEHVESADRTSWRRVEMTPLCFYRVNRRAYAAPKVAREEHASVDEAAPTDDAEDGPSASEARRAEEDEERRIQAAAKLDGALAACLRDAGTLDELRVASELAFGLDEQGRTKTARVGEVQCTTDGLVLVAPSPGATCPTGAGLTADWLDTWYLRVGDASAHVSVSDIEVQDLVAVVPRKTHRICEYELTYEYTKNACNGSSPIFPRLM